MSSPAYELARCPVCGSSDSTQVASADDVRGEVEDLRQFHSRRLSARVPPPRLADRLAFSQRPPLRLVRCAICETVFRNPAERAFELDDAYRADAPSPDAMRALFTAQRAPAAAQARRLTPSVAPWMEIYCRRRG